MVEGYEVVEGIKVDDMKPRSRHIMIRWFRKPETKGGIIIPQTRQRAGFMKGQILAIGPDCDPALEVGQLVEFNGLGDKEFIGPQDPSDRDTVFITRYENIYGIVTYSAGDKAHLQMVGSWILVNPDPEKEKTASGLLVPKNVQESQQRQKRGLTGVVRSAGRMQGACVDGEHIIFDALHATQIRIGDHNDEINLIISGDDEDGDVLGFLEN